MSIQKEQLNGWMNDKISSYGKIEIGLSIRNSFVYFIVSINRILALFEIYKSIEFMNWVATIIYVFQSKIIDLYLISNNVLISSKLYYILFVFMVEI